VRSFPKDRHVLREALEGRAPVLRVRRTHPEYLQGLLQDLVWEAADPQARLQVRVLDEALGLQKLTGTGAEQLWEPSSDTARLLGALIEDVRGGDERWLLHLRLPDSRLSEPAVQATLVAWAHRVRELGSARRLLLSSDAQLPEAIEVWVETLEFKPPRGGDLTEYVRGLLAEYSPDDTSKGLVVLVATRVQGLPADSMLEVIARATAQTRSRLLGLPVGKERSGRFAELLTERLAAEREQVLERASGLEVVNNDGFEADSLGGFDYLKAYLSMQAHILRKHAETRKKVPLPRGVLLVGLPGCGKSLAAQVAAKVMKLPLYRLDVGSLMGRWLGESERNLRDALTSAEAAAPCVLWVDELEKALGGLAGGSDGGGTGKRMLGRLLTWMQEHQAGVYLFATANQVEKLPPELLRRGRFDELFKVGLPKPRQRKEILRIHLRRWDSGLKEGELTLAVDKTDRFTGADIEALVKEARQRAWVKEMPLTLEHIEQVLQGFTPMSKQWGDRIERLEERLEKQGFRDASEDDPAKLPPRPSAEAHKEDLPGVLEDLWATDAPVVLRVDGKPAWTLQIEGPARARTVRMAEQLSRIGSGDRSVPGSLEIVEGELHVRMAKGANQLGEAKGLPALGPKHKPVRLSYGDEGLFVHFQDRNKKDHRVAPKAVEQAQRSGRLLPPQLVAVLRGKEWVAFGQGKSAHLNGPFALMMASRNLPDGLPGAKLIHGRPTKHTVLMNMVITAEGGDLVFLPHSLSDLGARRLVSIVSSEFDPTQSNQDALLDAFGWGRRVRCVDGEKVSEPMSRSEVTRLCAQFGITLKLDKVVQKLSTELSKRSQTKSSSTKSLCFKFRYAEGDVEATAEPDPTNRIARVAEVRHGGEVYPATAARNAFGWRFEVDAPGYGGPRELDFRRKKSGKWEETETGTKTVAATTESRG